VRRSFELLAQCRRSQLGRVGLPAVALLELSRIARMSPAYFVVARRGKAPLLPPYYIARSARWAGAAWPLPSSLASLARPGQRRASPAQHGGRAIYRRSQFRAY
jgi:hypothetical protein